MVITLRRAQKDAKNRALKCGIGARESHLGPWAPETRTPREI